MIRSFEDAETESLFFTGKSRKFNAILAVARRKLQVLDRTRYLDDLRQPYGNRLEALKGDRKGQHSIRVNDQFRICFRWHEGDAYEVEVVDYH
jgi:proteic killer suppression protein